MKTTALRLYGKRDLRLETFDLPEMQEDEILATVVTDSLCLSSWKEANLGENHKKVPDDVATNPIIIGHEFCGDILAVGKKWQHKFQPGQRYVIQANLQLPDRPDCPGYSFPWVGGEATHVVIPNEVMEQDCLLAYDGETYFEGSLVEPLSCVIGAFNANYHLQEGSYNHTMGIRPQGRTLILGGTGPMGLLAIDYALHGPVNPSLLVITDTDNDKLSYARKHYPSEPQTLIHYLNATDAAFDTLMALSGGHGFDDIFVFVPNEGLVTLASSLLATDGCLNFFAGPQDKHFSAPINFYDVHYAPGTYVRPHRHPHTFELLLPLRGRFVVLNFDDRGTVTHRAILGETCTVLEMAAGTWHAVLSLDTGGIIFEVKHGGYQPVAADDYAHWAPAEGEPGTTELMAWYAQAQVGDSTFAV